MGYKKGDNVARYRILEKSGNKTCDQKCEGQAGFLQKDGTRICGKPAFFENINITALIGEKFKCKDDHAPQETQIIQEGDPA